MTDKIPLPGGFAVIVGKHSLPVHVERPDGDVVKLYEIQSGDYNTLGYGVRVKGGGLYKTESYARAFSAFEEALVSPDRFEAMAGNGGLGDPVESF